MDFSGYTNILLDSVAEKFIILAIVGIFFLPGEISHLKSKLLNRKEEEEAGKGEHLLAFCFIVALVIVLSNAIPEIIDIANENYVSVHGEYYAESGHGSYIYVTTDDGEQLDLSLPFGSGVKGVIENDYVLWGEHEGTIWYAEKSKRMLQYIPDETG